MTRYAIAAMPDPGTPLWKLGCSILGYDALTGLDVPFPDHPAYHDPLSLAWSAEPRQDGLRATLKAPFTLAPQATEDALKTAMADFAKAHEALAVDLTLTVVGHFLALVPADPNARLRSLADDCVRHFDPFRAPLSPEDRERRHPDALIQRQVDNLDTWGDPFVFDDFQFHIPLTSALDAGTRAKVEPVLQEILSAAPLRFGIDALALFVQPVPEGRFVVKERFRLGA